jgi:hypothetical protein
MNAAPVLIGKRSGVYKAMAGAGAMTPAELSAKTNTDERYVKEWLSAQAAGGYVTYDAATRTFTLPNQQAFALAQEDSPAYMPEAFQIEGNRRRRIHPFPARRPDPIQSRLPGAAITARQCSHSA